MRYVLLLLTILAGGAGAAEPAKTADKNEVAAPDAARLERFLRRRFAWPATFQVTIAPFKPSPVAGLFETTVQVSHPDGKRELRYLVSADGQYLFQSSPLALSSDPFEETRAKIALKDVPSLGPRLAKVTVVEYSDFQCYYCRSAAPVLRTQLLKEFPTEVRLLFKDFPLAQVHPWAMPAAVLGRCIYKRDADLFWPYHDWVFDNQQQLTPENFKEKGLEFAKERGMDAAHLGVCMDQPEAKAEVNRALAEGQSVGVRGTPTVFINGRRLVGFQSLAKLRQVIEAELEYLRGE